MAVETEAAEHERVEVSGEEIGEIEGARFERAEVRKRRLNVPPTEPIGPEHYTADALDQIYGALFVEARALLAAGRAVILDASFLDPAHRQQAEALAREARVPFQTAWMEAPAALLEARIAARTDDASDATPAVLLDQLRRDLGPIDWPRVSTVR